MTFGLQHMLYCLVNVSCILINGLIWLHMYRTTLNTERAMYLRRAIASTIVFCLSDLLYGMADFTGRTQALMYVYNMSYFIATACMAYYWMIYAGLLSGWEPATDMIKRRWLRIPGLIVAVMALSSPWTHLTFYVNEAGEYFRGTLYILQPILTFCGTAFVCCRALVRSFSKEYYLKRGRYRSLFLMVVFPAIGLVISLLNSSLPTLCIGITVAVLAIELNALDEQVSLDPLTKLNNRRVMEKYLSERMQTYHDGQGKKRLYVFMMDMDNFKGINDNYGHVEGDRALVLLADVLRQTGSEFGGMIARYGGDEFARICELDNEAEAVKLCDRIAELMGSVAQEKSLKYPFCASIGYAEYDSKLQLPPDFVAKADRMLYAIKEQKKKGGA